MPIEVDQTPTVMPDEDQCDAAPEEDAELSPLAPLWAEDEYEAEVAAMVADFAPRLFAVFQDYGNRADGRIAAWGMAFEDHAEVVSVERRLRMSLRAPENALHRFNVGRHVRARLVWFNPDAATPLENAA